MLWPAVKMTDMVIGLDFHAVIIPPAPAPIPMVPHPYFGLIYLWMTPTFPKVNTLAAEPLNRRVDVRRITPLMSGR